MSSMFTPSEGTLRPVNMDVAIDVFSALLTPVIAAIAVYIAYQQWQTNRRKLDLDFYERRLRVYQAVTQFIGKVVKDLSPDIQDFSEFWRSTAEADFLFGSDIRDYLEELATRAANLRRWSDEYRDNQQVRPEGYDHSRVVEGQHKDTQWFAVQSGEAKRLFAKYLDITRQSRRWRRSIVTE